MINMGSVVLHNRVNGRTVVAASYSEMYVTSFQDGSEAMDIKVEEVTDVKEEEERKDPLAITCPTSDAEQEVSCVSVCPPQGKLHVLIFATLHLTLLTKWLCAIEWSLTMSCFSF